MLITNKNTIARFYYMYNRSSEVHKINADSKEDYYFIINEILNDPAISHAKAWRVDYGKMQEGSLNIKP